MERILVTIDEDPQAERVIEVAGELAAKLGATVTVCHVMPQEMYAHIEVEQARDHVQHPLSMTEAQERSKSMATEKAIRLKDFGVHFEVQGLVGEPHREILALAQAIRPLFIVMGFEGLHGLDKLRALGSVSRAVMEETTFPVLVVPTVVAAH